VERGGEGAGEKRRGPHGEWSAEWRRCGRGGGLERGEKRSGGSDGGREFALGGAGGAEAAGVVFL
jgi:hypothetical protein